MWVTDSDQTLEQGAEPNEAERPPHPGQKRPFVRQMVTRRAVAILDDVPDHQSNA